MELQVRIEAHALANALKYDGKASASNVLPKLLGEFPEQRARVQELKLEVEAVVARVNTLTPHAQREHLERIAPELLEKKEHKEKELPPLPNAVEGKVVTRIPPEPSKYNHIGHALTFLMNSIYADRYHGKVIVRFEDANPEKVNAEYTECMIDDITNYLGIRPAAIRYVSDDMETLYAYAQRLVEAGGAYMCFCDQETMTRNREQGIACSCRERSLKEQLHDWEEFKRGRWERGEAVLRYKGDMQSQNTVLRDPVLYRSVATPHFRQGGKYKVWPTYDFYSPIEEHLCGVTHILRSNEFDLRVELQEQIKRLLDLPDQEVVQYGRFNITGATTQGREIRDAIKNGEYLGWDDPRLVTLRALKRRGIRREAYYALVKTLGLSRYPVHLDFSMLAAANRKFVNDAFRYSFVADPQRVVVAGATAREVELDLHPDNYHGGRVFRVKDTFWISMEDLAQCSDKRVRLMGNLTFQEQGKEYRLVRYEQVAKGHDLIINWLPDDPGQVVPVEVMMPDATVKKGLAERHITNLKVDEVIQFERFGFCRLDAIEDGVYKFWYTHK